MWFLFKTTVLVVIAVLVRGTLPRYRIDQLITYKWKHLVFCYLFFVVELLCLYYIGFNYKTLHVCVSVVV
jgi:NADH:ubiquinone oxidoreductase subunit H